MVRIEQKANENHMKQRGRKSTAKFSVISEITDSRPLPPKELTSDQSEVWQRIVKAKPKDWFGADTFDMLCNYCRMTVNARNISEHIDDTNMDCLDDPDGFIRYERLVAMLDKQSRGAAALATKMRITQQAKYSPQKDGKARGGTAKKLWDA